MNDACQNVRSDSQPHRATSDPPTACGTPSTRGEHLRRFGYVLLHPVFDGQEMASLARRLIEVLEADRPTTLRSRGKTYGSRDLASLLPEVCDLARHSILKQFIFGILGPRAGVVRALYFDKPPGRSWSLPWHKDRTIAVKDNQLPTSHFRKPTIKAGMPHVEAPAWLLSEMLTLRVHVDAMTADNGPLSVIPASHTGDQPVTAPPVEIHADAGDVLAMRPLLSHASSFSQSGTGLHRRVVHLEVAPALELPDGYQWYSFSALS